MYCAKPLVNITRKVTARHGHTSGSTDNINNGKLDFYYHFMAILGLGVLDLFYFLVCSRYINIRSCLSMLKSPSKVMPKKKKLHRSR